MPALLEALKNMERNQTEMGAQLDALRATLTPRERMNASWFSRYAGLYKTLLAAGMPPETEESAIAEWLRGALGGVAAATGSEAGVTVNGDGTGCVDGRIPVILAGGRVWRGQPDGR